MPKEEGLPHERKAVTGFSKHTRVFLLHVFFVCLFFLSPPVRTRTPHRPCRRGSCPVFDPSSGTSCPPPCTRGKAGTPLRRERASSGVSRARKPGGTRAERERTLIGHQPKPGMDPIPPIIRPCPEDRAKERGGGGGGESSARERDQDSQAERGPLTVALSTTAVRLVVPCRRLGRGRRLQLVLSVERHDEVPSLAKGNLAPSRRGARGDPWRHGTFGQDAVTSPSRGAHDSHHASSPLRLSLSLWHGARSASHTSPPKDPVLPISKLQDLVDISVGKKQEFLGRSKGGREERASDPLLDRTDPPLGVLTTNGEDTGRGGRA